MMTPNNRGAGFDWRLANRIKPRPAMIAAALFIAVLALFVGSRKKSDAEVSTSPSFDVSVGEVNRDGWRVKPSSVDVSKWPFLKLNFSVERTARTPIRALDPAGIEARIDGTPLQISAADLQRQGGAAAGVLLVLDRSQSMTGGLLGASKIEAAKQALLTLLDSLNPRDRVAIASFDRDQRVVAPPSTDRETLRAAIRNFDARGAGTRLYDASAFALQFAESNGLNNIILISDGWEDSAASRQLLHRGGIEQYKREREREINERSRRTGIRLFTVAIGDKNPASRLYVDSVTLQHLSEGAAGAFSGYIDLPQLQREAGRDQAAYRRLLGQSLNEILTRIRDAFRYDYSLKLNAGSRIAPGEQRHLLSVTVTAEGAKLPLEIPFTFSVGDAAPVIGQWNALPAILIRAPQTGTGTGELAIVYLLLLALLGGLAAIPTAIHRIERKRETANVKTAIVRVDLRSALRGRECGSERDNLGGRYRIRAGDVVVVCPGCGTPHHLNCWNVNGDRCWNRACGRAMAIPTEAAEEMNRWNERKEARIA
jgi:Mg-chelatase subunit ChlD